MRAATIGTTEVPSTAMSPWSDAGAAAVRPPWLAFGLTMPMWQSSPASLLGVETMEWKIPPPDYVSHRDGRGFQRG